jgi:hypothetical protein
MKPYNFSINVIIPLCINLPHVLTLQNLSHPRDRKYLTLFQSVDSLIPLAPKAATSQNAAVFPADSNGVGPTLKSS